MGYYTKYDLTYDNFDLDEYRVVSALKEITNGYFQTEYSLEENLEEELKWYDHAEDLTKLSKIFPETLFILEGKGEDAEDIWREYYKNGKFQKCMAIITYEEPNFEYLGIKEE